MAFLRLADSLLALAIPPLSPPLRPILDRYSEMGERSVQGSGLSTDSRTTSAADWFVSLGSLLERLMQQVWHDYVQQQEALKVKISHHLVSPASVSFFGSGSVSEKRVLSPVEAHRR